METSTCVLRTHLDQKKRFFQGLAVAQVTVGVHQQTRLAAFQGIQPVYVSGCPSERTSRGTSSKRETAGRRSRGSVAAEHAKHSVQPVSDVWAKWSSKGMDRVWEH